MATLRSNLVIQGLSGMLGRQVVIRRQKNGSYVIAAPPRRGGERSEAQKAQQEQFRRAIAFSKEARALPEYQEAAEARGASTFNVAIADFLHPPEITKLDVSDYHGDAGQPIVITAIDDVRVKSVGVLIVAEDGTFVEKGAAVASATDPTEWTYTSTAKTDAGAVKIVADAADLAEHVTELTANLELPR
jgi:hypothetical protein